MSVMQSVYIQALESIRGSLKARAVEMREIVAKRRHAENESSHVFAFKKYEDLIEINLSGEGKPWTIMLLTNEIEAAQTSLSDRLEKEKEIAAAERHIAANRPHGKKRMRQAVRQAARQRPDLSLDVDSTSRGMAVRALCACKPFQTTS